MLAWLKNRRDRECDSLAVLPSCQPGSFYQLEAAVNVLSAAGTWELRVQLS